MNFISQKFDFRQFAQKEFLSFEHIILFLKLFFAKCKFR